MIIQNESLIYKEVIQNRSFLMQKMPDLLKQAINAASYHHYAELYEKEADTEVLLEDALDSILKVFKTKNQQLTQLRYVWMAFILAVVVKPTVKYYQPDNSIPENTIHHIKYWLLQTCLAQPSLAPQFNDNIKRIKLTDFEYFSSDEKLPNFQILLEALDVYHNALKTLEPTESLTALLDILEDCLEGYAIFPGSDGRRELFNWWLQDVVPSCWFLLPPDSLASLDTLTKNDKNAVLNELEKFSTLVWQLIITAVIQNQQRAKPLLLTDNKFYMPNKQLFTINSEVLIKL